MSTSRRDFVRCLGVAAASAATARPLAAWAERLRILGDGGAAEPAGLPGQVSPELRGFLAGVRVGEPGRHGPLRAFWLAGAPLAAPLGVATLEEARARGDLLIAERDQATVPELVVENRGKAYVLLLAGEILLGGKQNRVLTEDLLLPPLSGPRAIGVYCVEQGRWSGRSTQFDARGSFAAPGLRAKVLERAEQGRVWAEVDRYARSAAAPSATRSYQAIYDRPEVKQDLEEAERRLDGRSAPGALGAAVFVGAALAGLDLFFDPGLFAREWPKLLRAQAVEAYRRGPEAQPDERGLRGRAEELLRLMAETGGSVRTSAGVGRLFESRVAGYRACALVFEGRVVHTAIV
jgi:hypothetical protein